MNPFRIVSFFLLEKSDRPAPLLIWIHGGGWQNGSKENALPLRQGWVDRGYTDTVVRPEQSAALEEILQKQNIGQQRIVFSGEGHNIDKRKRISFFPPSVNGSRSMGKPPDRWWPLSPLRTLTPAHEVLLHVCGAQGMDAAGKGARIGGDGHGDGGDAQCIQRTQEGGA